MPKFSEKEKEIIRKKILNEGEKLFASIGLKKVTIDNLSSVVGISHSAFYAFYESKEQLFMEINLNKQKEIYKKLDLLIMENMKLPPKQLMKLYLFNLQKKLFSDPIISSMNAEIIELIARKVSPEVMQQNDLIDEQALCKLSQARIEFNYPVHYVLKITQAAFVGISCFEGTKNQTELAEIMLDSLIEKMLK